MTVGLTGGIGSGKSMVARVFSVMGCAVFDSDRAAFEVYFEKNVKEKVIELLGAQSYRDDKSINKQFISERIFNNDEARKALNAIIHPEVGKRFSKFLQKNSNKIIIKETALLFETGLENQVDKIVVVTAPEELRIKRVMQRDSLSKDEVIRKINSQLPEAVKIQKAHYVIHNDEQDFVITQVLRIYGDLMNV